jgi:DNA-binding transcriptional ArsR family regulator
MSEDHDQEPAPAPAREEPTPPGDQPPSPGDQPPPPGDQPPPPGDQPAPPGDRPAPPGDQPPPPGDQLAPPGDRPAPPGDRPAPPGAASQRFEDPRSIRALAHPARLAIIDALATGDELTATQCAELTGLSPSATAYHLKFLERHGFAETAPPRPDRRERPWRATGRRITVDLDNSTPAGASATAAVVAAYFDATRAIGLEFAEAGAAEPEQWRDDALLSNADLWLTAEEFRQLTRDLQSAVQPYRERPRPGDSRRVRVMNVVVPHRRGTGQSTGRENVK